MRLADQVRLGALARRDVEHRPQHAQGTAFAIEREPAAQFDPAFAAAGALEPRVEDERLAVGSRGREGGANALAILAMDEAPQEFGSRLDFVRRYPAEREKFVGPGRRLAVEVVVPTSEMGRSLRQREVFFGSA